MVDDGYFNVEECPVDEDFDISSGDDDLLAEEDDDDKENEVDDDEGEKEYGEDEDGNLMEIQMDKKEQKNPDTQDEDDLVSNSSGKCTNMNRLNLAGREGRGTN